MSNAINEIRFPFILLVFPQVLWVVYNKLDEPMMFWRLVLVNGKYE
jgi:hypothetical protein